jgi:hypothetical protein
VALFRLRRLHLGRPAPIRSRQQAVRRRASGALARWWRAVWFRLRFRVTFFFRRSDPAGLLVWLEGWGARHGTPRGAGETHRAYLDRLAALPGAADSGEALRLLADALDRQYFGGGGGTLPPGLAKGVRRRLRAAQTTKTKPAGAAGEEV